MAHQHSSSQHVRRSTRQKSSKKDADPLYSELPGQWQDFNFPDEEFIQPAIIKQGAAEAEIKRARLLNIAFLHLLQTIFVHPAHAICNCKSA